MELWKTTIDSIEERGIFSDQEYLELLNYYYGYIAWSIDGKKYNSAEYYIEKSKKIIKHLENKQYCLSSLYAYKAALIGYEIGISQYKAPFIGRKSLKYATQAIKADSENPMGYIQLGNIAFYTPALFGGSKKEALVHYLHAYELMKKNKHQIRYNWNYLNLLVSIINTYIKLEEYDKAEEFCLIALEIEPEFDWVKKNLYPKLLGMK
ncbi:tetratricopeptide repeat protein [Melioribacter sp. OK-6-Me]|uniref:tetratricopeptide repeat protein n=1 Tax=unclassified Melioribacter TaxID=2627329 RepID=UPI003ED98B39